MSNEPREYPPTKDERVTDEEEEEEATEDEAGEEPVEKPEHQAVGERVAETSGGHEEDSVDELHDIDMGSSQKGGDSSQEKRETPAPPPPFKAVNPKSRAGVHDKLRAYESRRRTNFQNKLESSSLYWRSFRDLLQSSVHETSRAERLVLGTAKAHQAYAEAMQASYEDGFLDKRNNVVLFKKQQKRLSDQRVETTSPNKTAPIMAATDEERKANMLTSIMEAQHDLAKKFGENAREMEEEIASELTQMRIELEKKVAGIHLPGDAILAELEKTEAEVSEAWEAYYTVADKALGGSIQTPLSPVGSPDASQKDPEVCNDVWVVEMQYLVAVDYQTSVWEKASTELSTLFASMKDIECQRRINLRELLLAFAQRQQRLFVSLPDVYTSALKDLVGRDIDRSAIEEKVQFSIRKRALLLQREEALTLARPTEEGSGLKGVLSDVEQSLSHAKLESPLMSELLCKAKIIDRRLPGLVATWTTSLAIITADSFLHLFDLPAGSPVHVGSAPEAAFHTLSPTVKVPSAEKMRSGKYDFIKGWCDGLIPTESLALHNCKITGHGTTFDVVETYDSRGASKMFRSTNTRKLVFRTGSEEETEEWLQALNFGHC